MAVELVILTPVLFVFAMGTLVFGRITETRQQVSESARAGAQAAAIMPDAQSAQLAASDSAAIGPSSRIHWCAQVRVVTDVSHYYPGGYVKVTVSCAVDLSDLSVPGVGSATTISESTTAPVDPYRSVQ